MKKLLIIGFVLLVLYALKKGMYTPPAIPQLQPGVQASGVQPAASAIATGSTQVAVQEQTSTIYYLGGSGLENLSSPADPISTGSVQVE